MDPLGRLLALVEAVLVFCCLAPSLRRSFALAGLVLVTGCKVAPIEENCGFYEPGWLTAPLVTTAELAGYLEAAPTTNAARAEQIAAWFEAEGCNVVRHPIGRSELPNVSCELEASDPGSEAAHRTVFVGAHHDKVREGRGIADNWTGVALLPLLYRVMAAAAPRHRYRFVAFGEEENELRGSTAFVKGFDDEDKAAIRYMLNLDTLGLGPPRFDPRSASALLCRLSSVARGLGRPVIRSPYGSPIQSDYEPFQERGVAILNLHSLTRRGFDIIHTRRDRMAAIDLDAYYDTYVVVSHFLAWMDALDVPVSEKGP